MGGNTTAVAVTNIILHYEANAQLVITWRYCPHARQLPSVLLRFCYVFLFTAYGEWLLDA